MSIDLEDEFENIERRRIKSVERILTAKIERAANDGVSIAYDENSKVILVRYALPGETVKIKIYKEAKDYCLGEPLEIIEPSPNRIKPPCKYFSLCGGCDYSMLDYENQIKLKTEITRETFKRIGKMEQVEFTDLIKSPIPYHYRNNVTFKVNSKNQKIGFFRKDTKSIIDIEKCMIADENINKALNILRKESEFPPHNVKVRITAKGDTVVNMIKTENFEDRDVYEEITAAGKTITFKISKDSFFQINNSVIPLWIEKIISFLNKDKTERIFDLYCGNGLITLFVSYYAKETIGVEISSSSVRDAIHNIKHNKIETNVRIIEGAVEDTIKSLGKADVIIVDPPRKGLDETTRRVLLDNTPQKIIYSSCKASTMARDIAILSQKYAVKEMVPVDMFPQTHHIEMLVLLELKEI